MPAGIGWRTPSEILPLEWRQVDRVAGEVRLDPGTTKNDEGRVFPFTAELRRILEEQRRLADRVRRERGMIPRYVFFHVVEMKNGTLGKKSGERITGAASTRRGVGLARRPAVPAESHTTSGERPCGTSSKLACPGRSR